VIPTFQGGNYQQIIDAKEKETPKERLD